MVVVGNVAAAAGLDVRQPLLCWKSKRNDNVPYSYHAYRVVRSIPQYIAFSAARTPSSPQGLLLKEQWRHALLAEAEEERKHGAHGRSGSSSCRWRNVRMSLYGRLYSEILWKVGCVDKGAVRPDTRGQNSSIAFIRRDGKGNSCNEDDVCIDGAIVELCNDGEMVVAVKAEDSTMLSLWSERSVGLDVVFGWKSTSVAIERQLRAVECLSSRMEGERTGARLLRAILLGSPKSVELASRTPDWMDSPHALNIAKNALMNNSVLQGFNNSQKRAIAGALARSMTLWQGPPGTGKTRTLLGLTYILATLTQESRILKSKMGKILAIAETNAAADNLVAGMNRLGIPCCRVGPVSRVRRELQHCTWEAQAEASAGGRKAGALRDEATRNLIEAKQLRESGILGALAKAQDLEFESQRLWHAGTLEMKEAMDNIMARCDVVVSTCVSAGDTKLQGYDFRIVIVDEATQATEPSTLIALTRGAECVIMAGDHAQLPPTVISKKAEKLGLNISLFSRLQTLGIQSHLLSVQYRMHPDINEFPTQEFYRGNVTTGIPASSRPPVSTLSSHERQKRVQFIDCEGLEKQGRASQGAGSFSYSNQAQCDKALEFVACVSKDDSVKSCLVLTPYNGQVDLLRRSLTDTQQGLLESGWLLISTVDGFQGQEADVVIFCTVRSNSTGDVGFLKDPRRMNVAITRARRSLLVIGSRATLLNEPIWKRWILWVEGFV